MIDGNLLFAGIIFGAFGMGYFVYGKNTSKFVSMFSGIILMIFPYFVSNIYYTVLIGIIFLILPFLIKL